MYAHHCMGLTNIEMARAFMHLQVVSLNMTVFTIMCTKYRLGGYKSPSSTLYGRCQTITYVEMPGIRCMFI